MKKMRIQSKKQVRAQSKRPEQYVLSFRLYRLRGSQLKKWAIDRWLLQRNLQEGKTNQRGQGARVQVRRRGLAQQRKSTDWYLTAKTKEQVRCIDSQQERNLWQVWCQKRLLHLKGCSLSCRFQQFETVHYAPKQNLYINRLAVYLLYPAVFR